MVERSARARYIFSIEIFNLNNCDVTKLFYNVLIVLENLLNTYSFFNKFSRTA